MAEGSQLTEESQCMRRKLVSLVSFFAYARILDAVRPPLVVHAYGIVVGQVVKQRGDKDAPWRSTMKLISRVTNRDMGHILLTLAEARKRPQHAGCLGGFPWRAV